MTLRLLGKLPEDFVIALSGGVDSMAVADFVARSRSVRCAFFHHGTATSDAAYSVVKEFCEKQGFELFVGKISSSRPDGISPEEHWRNERYAFLDSLKSNVVTAHHLDDCIETFIWSSMHGTTKVIPYRRGKVVRPFLLTPKKELIAWAKRNDVPWLDDFTNSDTKYMRNYVRKHIVPHAFEVNPGLHKVIARIVEKNFEAEI
jgi:tRNA(Ile)-lysidine synthase